MSAERRQGFIRQMERQGYTVVTRDERGLLVVTVTNLRGQVVASAKSTQRFDIETAFSRWCAYRASKPRGISRISHFRPERESA